MSIIAFIIALVLIGLVLWLVTTYLPLNPQYKNLIVILVIIVVIIWFLYLIGLLPAAGGPSIPRVR